MATGAVDCSGPETLAECLRLPRFARAMPPDRKWPQKQERGTRQKDNDQREPAVPGGMADLRAVTPRTQDRAAVPSVFAISGNKAYYD